MNRRVVPISPSMCPPAATEYPNDSQTPPLSQAKNEEVHVEKNRKRRRATVVAEQGGKVLLVRERRHRQYGLPGGGIEGQESVIEAACREIREETKLAVVSAEHLFDYEGHVMFNQVVLAKVKGRVRLQRRELSDYLWWDGVADIPMGQSAKAILSRVKSRVWR